MDKRNKKILIILFSLGIVFLTLGVSVAFFNYTRTGGANTVRVGRISFNATQNGTINLSNVFPITSTEAETDTNNSDTVSLRIVGDTDYDKGIEYLVSLDDVNIAVNNKKVPINLEVSVTGTGLGSEETGDYYSNRESYTESKYKKEIGNNLNNGSHVIVGYISKNETLGTASGIDGTINIKAYIDADRIAISDTYDGTESDNMGTTTEWVNGRTVFTTSEWNNLNLSFKIKVEANEGIWVEKPATPTSCFTTAAINVYKRNPDMNINTCVSKLTEFWGAEEEGNTVDTGETYQAFCEGTGTNYGETFDERIGIANFDTQQLTELENSGIINKNTGAIILDYDASCGSDVVIPSSLDVAFKTYAHNTNVTTEEINSCVNYLNELGFTVDTSQGETLESFCQGTGTVYGTTLQEGLNNNSFTLEELSDLEQLNIINIKTGTPAIADISYIESNSFANKNLTSVTIPNSVKSVGSHAFIDNENLVSITIDMDEIPSGFACVGECFYSSTTNEMYTENVVLRELILGSNVKKIGSEAFSGNQLTSVTIPNSVTTIGEYAFQDNQLTNVIIPNSVTTIEHYAFSGNQLTSVTIPNSVTTIESSTFSNNQLTSVTIPNSVTTIEHYAFSKNQLTSVTIPNGVTTIGYSAFENNQLTNVIIPNSVTAIGYQAFSSNQLTSVTIPNSVTTIESSTFSNNQLTSVTIPNSVTTIGSNAFYGNQLTSVTIPNSVTTIGSSAFAGNQLASVTIPNSVTTIEYSAFSNNQLTSVTIGNGINSIGSTAFTKNATSNPNLASIKIDKSCSVIKNMNLYPWLHNKSPYTGSYSAGTTIYGSNNEVCNAY